MKIGAELGFSPFSFTAGFGPSGPGCFKRSDPQYLSVPPVGLSGTWLSGYFLRGFPASSPAASQSASAVTKHGSWNLGLGSPPLCFPPLQVLGTARSNCLHTCRVPSEMCFFFLLHLPFLVFLALSVVSCKVIHQGQGQKSSVSTLLSLKIKS